MDDLLQIKQSTFLKERACLGLIAVCMDFAFNTCLTFTSCLCTRCISVSSVAVPSEGIALTCSLRSTTQGSSRDTSLRGHSTYVRIQHAVWTTHDHRRYRMITCNMLLVPFEGIVGHLGSCCCSITAPVQSVTPVLLSGVCFHVPLAHYTHFVCLACLPVPAVL